MGECCVSYKKVKLCSVEKCVWPAKKELEP